MKAPRTRCPIGPALTPPNVMETGAVTFAMPLGSTPGANDWIRGAKAGRKQRQILAGLGWSECRTADQSRGAYVAAGHRIDRGNRVRAAGSGREVEELGRRGLCRDIHGRAGNSLRRIAIRDHLHRNVPGRNRRHLHVQLTRHRLRKSARAPLRTPRTLQPGWWEAARSPDPPASPFRPVRNSSRRCSQSHSATAH